MRKISAISKNIVICYKMLTCFGKKRVEYLPLPWRVSKLSLRPPVSSSHLKTPMTVKLILKIVQDNLNLNKLQKS